MFSYVYNYFNGNNVSTTAENNSVVDVDSMDLDQFLDFIKNKDFKKINTNDPKYLEIIRNLNIDQEELLLFEYELYEELYKKLGDSKPTGENVPKNPLLKKKIYVEPKFDKNAYQTINYDIINSVNTENSNDTTQISFDYVRPANNVQFNDKKITLQEFNDSFRDSQNGKDMLGISKAMIENLPELLKQSLIKKFNNIIDNQNNVQHKPHNVGKGSLVYKIAKRGAHEDVASFRQIIAIPSIVSHMHRILALRISDHLVKNNIMDTTIQKGGVSGANSTMFDQIIKVKNIIKYANASKQPLSAVFIDLSDAFPSLNINKMLQVLEKYGVPKMYTDYIKRFYTDFKYYTATKSWKSDNIKWKRGLLQGCPLSPILFVTVLNYVLKYLENKHSDKSFEYESTTKQMNKLMFAAYMDDIVLMTKSNESSKLILDELEKLLSEFGLKMNRSKTAYMNINVTDEAIVGLEKVEKYKYLGEWLWYNGNSINSFNTLLSLVKGKLVWVDEKSKFDKFVKSRFITTKLIPMVQRKFTVLYDIQIDQKIKIINMIKYYIEKWEIDNVDINIVFNVQNLLNGSKDDVLNNMQLYDVECNIDDKLIKERIDNIEFDYAEQDGDDLTVEEIQKIYGL